MGEAEGRQTDNVVIAPVNALDQNTSLALISIA
jgi:hypothetical protein